MLKNNTLRHSQIYITTFKEGGFLRRINMLTNGGLVLHADKYPKLVELDKILNGCFDTIANNIHYISKRD